MTNKGFFQSFFAEYNYIEWVKIIDWLFDDDKYADWTSYKIGLFVKEYKKLSVIDNALYIYGKRSEVTPSDYNYKKYRKKSSIIVMVAGSGEGRDIVRHIRNGIAHGRANLRTRNGVRCIELIDFGKYGNKSEKGGQTAYILIPVETVRELYKIYERL